MKTILKAALPRRMVFALSLALVGVTTSAQEARIKDIRVTQPMATSTVSGQPAAGAYITIENLGKESDRLLKVSSPVAERVEIHVMKMENDIMRMREIGPVEIKAGQKIQMGASHPDRLHLMLMQIRQPLKEGEKFPLTLEFEKAGRLDVTVSVSKDARSGGHKH